MNSSLIKKLKNISEKEKQFLVQKIFSKVSKKYDLMNDVMSLGLHRTWKSYFVDLIEINTESNVLDIASGSGDIIKLLKKKATANFARKLRRSVTAAAAAAASTTPEKGFLL